MIGTISIFVSYAREDKRWLQSDDPHGLIPWLQASVRKQDVVFWHDKDLIPGNFTSRIEEEIDRAQIALLLVSQAFLNSEYIEETELPRIKARQEQGQLEVVPILVGACGWGENDFLRSFQILPGPTPLIKYTKNEADWDEVRAEILDGLKKLLKRIRATRSEHRTVAPAVKDLALAKETDGVKGTRVTIPHAGASQRPDRIFTRPKDVRASDKTEATVSQAMASPSEIAGVQKLAPPDNVPVSPARMGNPDGVGSTNATSSLRSMRSKRIIPHNLGTRELTLNATAPKISNVLVIPRGAECPVSRSRDFKIPSDNQPFFDVHVVEFEDDNNYETVGTFRFTCLPNSKLGDEIRVTFTYDTSGILSVQAIDIGSGTVLAYKRLPYTEPDLGDRARCDPDLQSALKRFLKLEDTRSTANEIMLNLGSKPDKEEVLRAIATAAQYAVSGQTICLSWYVDGDDDFIGVGLTIYPRPSEDEINSAIER